MHLFGLTVLACFTVTLQLPAPLFEEENEESRVFGGRFANQGEFPWMVHLTIRSDDNTQSICGGFIISKRHVMTAAHCVCDNATTKSYADAKDITGRIGNIHRNDATQVKFDKVYVHENYDDDYNADIAILKLTNPLTKYDNNVQSINVADAGSKFPNRQAVIQMGWGRFDNGTVITSPTLKTTALGYILDKPSCTKEMRTYADPGQFCVSNLKGEKICGGDSGGPLCLFDQGSKLAIGIVSFDYFDWCVKGNDFPAIYTDISYYANWVKKKISDNEVVWVKKT